MGKLVRNIVRVAIGFLILLVAYAYWPGGGTKTVAELADATDKFVTVEGLSIRYREFGAANPGEAGLVLIHGYGNNLGTWRGLAPELAKHHRVVAFDLPGFGLSAMPGDYDFSRERLAGLTVTVAHALQVERPVYVGHSMGGNVALIAGANDPRTAGVVLIDPGILGGARPGWLTALPPPLPRVIARLSNARIFRERMLRQSYANPDFVTDALVRDVMLASDRAEFIDSATAMVRTPASDDSVWLPRARGPVLLIFGAVDPHHPAAERQALRAALAGSKLVEIPDAGHYPHEENPLPVAGAIQSVLMHWHAPDGTQALAGSPR